MKKLLLCLGVFGILCVPAIAKEKQYMPVLPYKEYNKEITLQEVSNQNFENDFIKIVKTKYNFKYSPKYGNAYVYVISGVSNKNVILKWVNSGEYFNRDRQNKHGKVFGNAFRTMFTSWQFYVPLYDMYYGIKSDCESAPYLRDFPQYRMIGKDNELKILTKASPKYDNPIAEFVFKVDNEEKSVSF